MNQFSHCILFARLILEGSGTKVSEVKLLAPIPRPTGVIMCIGKNYLDHVKEVDTWKTHPGITKPEAPKVNCLGAKRFFIVGIILIRHVEGVIRLSTPELTKCWEMGPFHARIDQMLKNGSTLSFSPKRPSQSLALELPSSIPMVSLQQWTTRQVNGRNCHHF